MDDARYVAPAGCLLIAFYFESADQLTAKERRFVIRMAGPRLRNWTRKTDSGLATEDWTFKHKFLVVDFAPFVRTVGDRLEKLAAAGFTAHRASENIGHNAARMAFVARPATGG